MLSGRKSSRYIYKKLKVILAKDSISLPTFPDAPIRSLSLSLSLSLSVCLKRLLDFLLWGGVVLLFSC